MRRVLIALALLATLLFASVAVAGGWATVGLSSTPAGTQPGDPWAVQITVLQHGRTPLAGVQPTLTIRSGDATKTFAAKATEKPGVYAATVIFPTAGKWTYEVNDGFVQQQSHTFPAVEIGAPANAPVAATQPAEDGGPNMLWLALGGLCLVLALVLLVARRHGRGHEPQAA